MNEPMTLAQFFIVWGLCLVTMLLCRCIPIFVLQGREMPEGLAAALGFIPVAAFAALVANDLFSPTMFDGGVWQGVVPLISAGIVLLVARKTGSLIWCALTGVVVYALLAMAPVGF